MFLILSATVLCSGLQFAYQQTIPEQVIRNEMMVRHVPCGWYLSDSCRQACRNHRRSRQFPTCRNQPPVVSIPNWLRKAARTDKIQDPVNETFNDTDLRAKETLNGTALKVAALKVAARHIPILPPNQPQIGPSALCMCIHRDLRPGRLQNMLPKFIDRQSRNCKKFRRVCTGLCRGNFDRRWADFKNDPNAQSFYNSIPCGSMKCVCSGQQVPWSPNNYINYPDNYLGNNGNDNNQYPYNNNNNNNNNNPYNNNNYPYNNNNKYPYYPGNYNNYPDNYINNYPYNNNNNNYPDNNNNNNNYPNNNNNNNNYFPDNHNNNNYPHNHNNFPNNYNSNNQDSYSNSNPSCLPQPNKFRYVMLTGPEKTGSQQQAESRCARLDRRGRPPIIVSPQEQCQLVQYLKTVHTPYCQAYWLGFKKQPQGLTQWLNTNPSLENYANFQGSHQSDTNCIELQPSNNWHWHDERCDSANVCIVCQLPIVPLEFVQQRSNRTST